MLEATPNNRSSVLNTSDATLGSSQALFLGLDSGLIQTSQHSAVASLDSNLPLIPLLSTSSNQAVEYTEFPLALSKSLSLSEASRWQSSSLGSETVGDMESNRSDRLLSGGKSQGKNKAGNSLNKAQRIKLTSQWQMTEDSVGTGDRFDIYRFDLKKSKSFRLKLASQQDSVDVLLLNDAGETVRDLSGPFGKKRVVLNTALDTGTYYLKVTGHDSDTDYQLSLSNEPGGARRSAQPIGSNEKTWVETIGLRDKFDLYRFDVDKKSTVRGRLKGLQSNADLALMNSQGQMIQASRRFGKKNESVGATLEKGTYYLKVTGWGEETKYRLNMVMKEEPVPPTPDPRTDVPNIPRANTSSIPGTGIFTVGETGKVSIDYLFDGSESQGELAIFNLAGMEQYGVGSERYIQEAMLRSLRNLPDSGYVVILDQTEGAKFSSSPGEPNFNAGEYRGTKTFTMRSGDKFGVMLVPSGTTPDKLFKTDLSGDQRPLFSMPDSNSLNAIQFTRIIETRSSNLQVVDGNTFGFEDSQPNINPDWDYDDLVFQVRGAATDVPSLDEVINTSRDWRGSESGKKLMSYADVSQKGLTAWYYNNADFTNYRGRRTDGSVNFDWGAGSPSVMTSPDSFSIRWLGRNFSITAGRAAQ
jgi:Domain of unknown function (DUF4114)/PA14 domain